MLLSLARVLLITDILAASLGTALIIGMILADMGFLGTCQDGTCQLIAAVYVMPLGGIGLYIVALVAYSIVISRRIKAENRR